MKTHRLFFPLITANILILIFLMSSIRLDAPVSASSSGFGTTWYVDAAIGNDANDCLTPSTACLTIDGAVGKATSGDSIQIAAGTYQENLDINLDLAFHGVGMETTFLDGGQVDRTFIASSTHITLTHLSIQNGQATGSGFDGSGAGINNYGGLFLNHVRVWQNSSQDGGAGIFTSGNVTLHNSQVISNTAGSAGGGIYIWGNGGVTMTQSLIAGNEASQGGGIFAIGELNISDSTISHNTSAIFGGGLVVLGSTAVVDVERVTIRHNQTDGYGAGIVNNYGVLTLTNVTVSHNQGENYTGLANISNLAQTTILNSTFAENQASTSGVGWGGIANINDASIALQNTILSGNDDRNCLVQDTWASQGYNLSTDSYCNLTQPGDMENTNPYLAPLADYGGPSWTHALSPGSPAIDSGTNSGCPPTDQRGIARPFDGDNDGTATCDRGAFEAQNQLAISDTILLEGNVGTTNAVFTVTLSPTSTLPVTVSYMTVDGSAIAGSDYATANSLIVFDPGENVKSIAVPIIGDTDDEPNETFYVQLLTPLFADILDGEGTGTIIDDDGLPSLTITPVSIEEGNSGTTAMTFIVSLLPSHFQTVNVDFETSNGSATAGEDYLDASGTLTFDPGVTTQEITVDIVGDIVDEGESESFTMSLTNPENANLDTESAEGTILDNDIARVSLGISREVLEGNGGTATLVFSVTLETPTSFPVTVDFYSQSGTGGTFATPGIDYEDTSGTLTFAPGETEKTFAVTIYGDYEVEEDEHFGVYLTNASPIGIYGSASTGYILNDDDGTIPVFLPIVVR